MERCGGSMLATFSRWCLEHLLLLLLLLCTSLSGRSSADPVMTTQDFTQTQANAVTKMQAVFNESSVSDFATQEVKPAGKENTYDVLEYEIELSGVPGPPLEKNVPVASPSKVELTCKLDENSKLKKPEVTWKKGSETISHTSKTQNSWTIQLTISESSQLGSYTCFLKGEVEVSATFHLQVPKAEGREKPIITYLGDTGVMLCRTEFTPKTWVWYMTNGTELVPIDKILPKDKFEIKSQSATVDRLEIHKLTKEDAGVYWCEAVFVLGVNKGRFELKVLSISEPLKPFIAIVAEVALLVTLIALYEVCSKKKGKGDEREFDQIKQLKSEDSVTGTRK